MRGFSERATVEQTVAWLESVLPPFESLPVEEVSLLDGATRILAHEVKSLVNVPAFTRSMMDGYALLGEQSYGASNYNPLPLQIIGTCFPGRPFDGHVLPGQAVRIMTGAPLPDGADAVLPVENSSTQGQTLLVMGEVTAGKHIGQIGEDVSAGEVILPARRLLRPQDIGVVASIGVGRLPVIRRPRVRIIITGNELLPAGTPPEGCRIADANGPMLLGLVHRDGGTAITGDIVPDCPDALRAALADEADVILVSGGSSVGQEDYVPKLLSEAGELAIHGVAMRPSSPAGMGRLNNRLVFLLPGNPVSCLCAYDFFAGRAIRALGGRSQDWPYRRQKYRLSRKLVSTVGRVDYARVRVSGVEAEPLAISGASVLSSTTRADGFVIVPADCEGYPEGDEIEVFLYGD